MTENSNEGYIYIYKCVVGACSGVCKIGITTNYQDRLKQHVRTPYYGFMPYIEFTTGNPIATVFKVKKYDLADELINKIFKQNQFGNLEIYSIDYDLAIEKLYNSLVENNRLVDLIKDNYSMYEFLNTTNDDVIADTKKISFEKAKEKILIKYNDNLPEKLLIMLKDKEEFMQNCYSHFQRGNYIEFPNNMILDLNFNKEKRIEILKKLEELL